MVSLDAAKTIATKLIANYQSPKLADSIKKEEQDKATQVAKDQYMAEITKTDGPAAGSRSVNSGEGKRSLSATRC